MKKTARDRIFAVQEYFATLFVSRLRRRVFAAMIVIAVLAGMFLFSNKGLVRRMQLSAEKQRLEQHLQELQRQQDSLRTLRDQMQNDSFAIEKVAREQYGLIRPGETVYRRDQKRDTK